MYKCGSWVSITYSVPAQYNPCSLVCHFRSSSHFSTLSLISYSLIFTGEHTLTPSSQTYLVLTLRLAVFLNLPICCLSESRGLGIWGLWLPERQSIFCPLVHCPNSYNNWNQAHSEPGASSDLLIRRQGPLLLSQTYYQGARSKMQLRLEPEPKWDASTTGRGLAWYTTAPSSPVIFILVFGRES